MAALARCCILRTRRLAPGAHVPADSYVTKAQRDKMNIDMKVCPKIYSEAESLAAKGFLRPQKEYVPPADVSSKLDSILQKTMGTSDKSTNLTDPDVKFTVLSACYVAFQHSVPNSLLHTIGTVGDVYKFYKTPVDIATPLDKMRTMELPKNLHVQFEYHRFHPDTDKMFGGITAYPGSSTLIPGIKHKNKYKGHIQEPVYPTT